MKDTGHTEHLTCCAAAQWLVEGDIAFYVWDERNRPISLESITEDDIESYRRCLDLFMDDIFVSRTI